VYNEVENNSSVAHERLFSYTRDGERKQFIELHIIFRTWQELLTILCVALRTFVCQRITSPCVLVCVALLSFGLSALLAKNGKQHHPDQVTAV